MSPTLTSMLATVPSAGATTGISIFIASRITTASPFLTWAPTCFSILKILPAAPASTLMEPAPAAGAAALGAAGAALGAALGAAAGAAATPAPSSTVTSYTLPLTVIV